MREYGGKGPGYLSRFSCTTLLWVPSQWQGLLHKIENLNSHEVGGIYSRLPTEKYNPHCTWFKVGMFIGKGEFAPLVSRNLRLIFVFVIIKHVQ